MKKIINIKPNTYPLRFIVFFNYKNKDKPEIINAIKGTTAYTLKHMTNEINETDLEEKGAWTFICRTLFVITIHSFDVNNPEHYGYLQHELQHSVLHSGRAVHFKLSEDSEEYYCYMMQFLTERIYKKLWL